MFLRQNLFDHLSGRVIPPNGYIWHFIIEDTCFESQLHKSHRIHTTIIDFLLFIINMTVSWTEVMVTSYLTWHFALFSSNLVKAWKFFAGMFGAFFIHINALHRKGNTIINDREDKGLHTKNINKKNTHTHTCSHKRRMNERKINASYLVLQGLPTTITLTLRDATALRAFPCNI